jgi:hypothetical protein
VFERSANPAVPATQQALEGSARMIEKHNYVILIYKNANMQDEKILRHFMHIPR